MKPLGVLVADDERPARAKVVRLLRHDSRFVLAGEARDGIETLAQLAALQPALLIVDVQMPGLDGFEVLRSCAERFDGSVIFSTAYEAHALRAFEAHAADYLLKPYDAPRFQKALDKAYALQAAALHARARCVAPPAAAPTAQQTLSIKTIEGVWLTIAYDEILRVSAANKYTCIVQRDGQQLVRLPLRDLAARLDERFVRTHRGELVNLHKVVRCEPATHGDALLVLDDDSRLVLTRTHRRAFLRRFESL